jgi:acetyltransferase-like isoleucine patch superfamily enzyme
MHIGRNSIIAPQAFIEQPENIYIGDNVQIKPGVVLRPEDGFIDIGNHVVINHYTVIHAKGGVEIGDWSIIAPHCGIYAQNHSFDSFETPITKQPNKGIGITFMGDNWLGGGAIVLDGVTLGKGTVVGAGAVVTQSFPMAKIIAGNPARVIKSRFPEDQWDFQKVERCSVGMTPSEYWSYIDRRAEFCARYLKPEDVVLDVGCGEGYLTNKLKRRCKTMIGIDYAEDAIQKAKRFPGVEYYHMNATDLRFDDERFDKILCLELLEHLSSLQARKGISEMYRVLKKGGMMIGSTPIRTSPGSIPSCYAHIYEYSENELRELLGHFCDIQFVEKDFFGARKP